MIQLLLLVLLAGPVWAASKSCPAGTIAAAQTATGASTDTVTAKAATALTVQAQNTAGTATVALEICCLGPCDATGAWAAVTGGSMALTVGTAAVSVANPACAYRANTTACSTCNVTVGYACSGP